MYFLRRTVAENRSKVSSQLKYELKVIEDMITNINKLNLEGMAVKVNNEIAAFTLGKSLMIIWR